MNTLIKSLIFYLISVSILFLADSRIVFALDDTVYTIRFTYGLPDRHRLTVQFNDWAKMINEESGGRLAVKMYPGGQLFNEKNTIAAVITGGCEMGALYPFYLATIIPEFKVFGIPMVIQKRATLITILDGHIMEKLFAKIEAKGIQPIGSIIGFISEEAGVISKTPVRVPSDLQGKKIRSTNSEQMLYFEKFCGASSVFVSGAELYTALQRGTLDATVGSLTHQVDRKLYEISPYICMIPIVTGPEIFIMNKEFYDSLPNDLQQVISRVSDVILKKSYTIAEYDYENYLRKAKKVSKEVHLLTPEEFSLWNAGIEDFWKRVTEKYPEVYDMIMEIQNLN